MDDHIFSHIQRLFSFEEFLLKSCKRANWKRGILENVFFTQYLTHVFCALKEWVFKLNGKEKLRDKLI